MKEEIKQEKIEAFIPVIEKEIIKLKEKSFQKVPYLVKDDYGNEVTLYKKIPRDKVNLDREIMRKEKELNELKAIQNEL